MEKHEGFFSQYLKIQMLLLVLTGLALWFMTMVGCAEELRYTAPPAHPNPGVGFSPSPAPAPGVMVYTPSPVRR